MNPKVQRIAAIVGTGLIAFQVSAAARNVIDPPAAHPMSVTEYLTTWSEAGTLDKIAENAHTYPGLITQQVFEDQIATGASPEQATATADAVTDALETYAKLEDN